MLIQSANHLLSINSLGRHLLLSYFIVYSFLLSKFLRLTPGNSTKFPNKHLQALPDPILLKYLTSH